MTNATCAVNFQTEAWMTVRFEDGATVDIPDTPMSRRIFVGRRDEVIATSERVCEVFDDVGALYAMLAERYPHPFQGDIPERLRMFDKEWCVGVGGYTGTDSPMIMLIESRYAGATTVHRVCYRLAHDVHVGSLALPMLMSPERLTVDTLTFPRPRNSV